jgi:hypothetical protein
MRAALAALFVTTSALAADPSPVAEFLKRPLLPADEVTLEIRDHVRPKVARLRAPGSAADWEREAKQLRDEVLSNAVFRGEAAKWRDAMTRVEYLVSIRMDG